MRGTVTLELTQDQVTVIDKADVALVSQHTWYAVWSEDMGSYYAATKVRRPDGTRRVLQMQRFLMGEPERLQVDHRNGDTLDNRRKNLRVATNSQNKANTARYKTNSSGYKGVYEDRRADRWTAQIRHQGKLYWLGMFDSPRSAARAYDHKARELFGEFAGLNFPTGNGAEPEREDHTRHAGSGQPGAYANGDKWAAKISLGGKRIYLGTFATPEEAGAAYAAALSERERDCQQQ